MINFSELPLVALDFMNQDHQHAVDLINDIEKQYELADVSAVEAGLKLLQEHCIEHFAHEEKEMRKYSFPPYQVHKQEHDRVLMELDMVIKQLNNHRDLSKILGYLKNEFPTWFAQHLATMDRMTAQFIAMNM
ncbi:MAG: hemerythrin family protein [Oleispira sp.]|nr:hemerythrin family protein [Oleispira sp.]MBL4882463.1 hemerythrin family protein [Oleispira sp.]